MSMSVWTDAQSASLSYALSSDELTIVANLTSDSVTPVWAHWELVLFTTHPQAVHNAPSYMSAWFIILNNVMLQGPREMPEKKEEKTIVEL